jgi:hypothetical protein
MVLVYRLSYPAMYINRIFCLLSNILCVYIVILTFERFECPHPLLNVVGCQLPL